MIKQLLSQKPYIVALMEDGSIKMINIQTYKCEMSRWPEGGFIDVFEGWIDFPKIKEDN